MNGHEDPPSAASATLPELGEDAIEEGELTLALDHFPQAWEALPPPATRLPWPCRSWLPSAMPISNSHNASYVTRPCRTRCVVACPWIIPSDGFGSAKVSRS
jgi:hypothetical protein